MKKLYLIFLLIPMTVKRQAILYHFPDSGGTFNYLNKTSVAGKILTVTGGNQVIPFDPIASHSPAEGAFDLTASSSSGLPLSYRLSKPAVASVQGNLLTLHSPGTTAITASQSGDNLYPAAADVSRRLTVNNPAPQTITFNPLAPITFGISSITVTATSSSGLPVSFSGDNSAVANVNSSGLIAVTGAGTVRIKASQGGNAAYHPAPDKVQELLVNKADQALVFPEIPTHYITDPPFTILAAAGSNLPLTFTFSDPTVAKAEGNTVKILSIGVTTVTAVQKGDNNYNPSPEITQTLTVSKLSQTIDFLPIPGKSNTGLPFTVTATATSGLPVSFISSDRSVATVNGNLITILNEGQTNIIANQPGDADYLAAPQVVQPLVVTSSGRLPQYITFPAIGEKHLGGNRFFLTATATSRLPIIYSCNSKVAISDEGIVTLLQTGMAVITAGQSGNNSYSPAAHVERTFCINPLAPVISENTGILTSNATAGNQWYKEGVPIPDAVAAVYAARDNGSYTAKVIIETCASPSSNALIISTTGDISKYENLIFPNPVRDLLSIKWNQPATVNILTITGQMLYTSTFTGRIDLDMKAYPTGIYMVKITGEETVVKKVVKY